ncbi:hypothetical protein K1719_009598 [Acacia pycnantha]|nr:hypothetical protein K1719_009598 [Acacia pycnantha]
METPFAAQYHNYLNSVVSAANIIAVYIHYRRAPEHPLPTTFKDSWTSLNRNNFDELLNRHDDFKKVFFAKYSAEGNIAHHIAIQAGTEGSPSVNLEGVILVHPFFLGVELVGSEMREAGEGSITDNLWRFVCPTTKGSEDSMLNPVKDSNVGRFGCRKILVCVVEKDGLKERGWYYKKVVEKKSEWKGVVEAMGGGGEG